VLVGELLKKNGTNHKEAGTCANATCRAMYIAM
jgi:hypothetical protein